MFIKSLVVGTSILGLAACSGSTAPEPSHSVDVAGDAAATADAGGPTLAPIPGSQRISFELEPFDIPAGGEYYKCQDYPNPFGEDIAILQSLSVMTYGSHHMFVFRLSNDGFFGGTPNLGPGNTKGPLFDCPSGGAEFHPFVHAAQTPVQEFVYPKGMGQAFKSDETVRLMVHYLNTSTGVLHAKLNVTMDYVGANQVQTLAASIFLNSLGVTVPPGTSTQGFSFQLPQAVNLLGASGHMHRRGTHFEATAVAGDGSKTELYQTNTWDEPTAAAFSPAMPIESNTTIHWACTYTNTGAQTFVFGQSANSNEMCIFTGTYYPSADGNGLYDNDIAPGTPN